MTSRAERARKIQAAAEGEGSAIRDALTVPKRVTEPEPDQIDAEPEPEPGEPDTEPPKTPKSTKTTTTADPPPSPKERTVRYTIDLDESLHRRLKLVALDNRVRASEVFRAALDGHTDDELAKLIEARRQTTTAAE